MPSGLKWDFNFGKPCCITNVNYWLADDPPSPGSCVEHGIQVWGNDLDGLVHTANEVMILANALELKAFFMNIHLERFENRLWIF